MGKVIKATHRFLESDLLSVVESLKNGGIVCMATDTVYGLSCIADNEEAVRRLAKLKGETQRPFLVLIGELLWLEMLASEISPLARRLIERHWPGPLTVVFKARSEVGPWLRGPRGTIAVRCPKSPLCEQLLKALGKPVVSSSANVRGEGACLTGSEACDIFLEKVDFVVDSGPAAMSLPSTIVDVTLARPAVLRQGTLDIDSTQLREDESR